ncbi:MAG: class I SAM-dependent methyltransferase [Alphaproteobacteria bacterium]|nr:class I SAM-dependent methyltransferase [Alphaproteobacteria bacterium]
MTEVFGNDYAAAYDALYGDKDYEGECDLVLRLLAAHGGAGAGRRLLDLGCGTGNHAFPLARRGHAVTGVDRSPDMLERARAKTGQGAPAPAFHQADLRDLDLGRRFDAVLMMFAVLGYQHENADLLAALRTVRRHLEPGGLFVFDVWNGPAVLTDRPGRRVRPVETAGGPLVRTADSRLDVARQLCHVRFALRGPDGFERAEEHTMRFFSPPELDLALGCAGLRLLDLRSLPDGEGPPDERAWTVIGVARALVGPDAAC